VLHFHRVLHEAFACAVKWGLLAVNPADAVTPPKVRRKEPAVLTEEETSQLLEAAAGTRLHLPILLAVASGLRRGELLALRWSDIDLEACCLTVRRTLSETQIEKADPGEGQPKREGKLAFKEPKSKTSRRSVALPAFAVEALKAHAKKQKEHRLSVGPAYQDQGLVFPADDGRPWAPNLLTSQFGNLVRKLDLPTVRFHDLRHGHITQLLLRGVPLKVVSARAGHSGIAITADLYGHLLPGADEQAAAKLDGVYSFSAAENGAG
jgi:integrase